jgi:hypothetical protein
MSSTARDRTGRRSWSSVKAVGPTTAKPDRLGMAGSGWEGKCVESTGRGDRAQEIRADSHTPAPNLNECADSHSAAARQPTL